jgi:nitroreductase
MEAMDAILSRRSIRRYTTEPVPEKVIEELLEAAMSAPSAHNTQPWHFVVVNDRVILDEIPKFHPYADMLPQAPMAILVCGDLQLDAGRGFWVQDCSAAAQNILVAANAKGLGAVWVGIYPVEEKSGDVIRNLIGLPENIIPLCLIPMGYPVQAKPPANRYDSSRIHNNRW